MIAKLHFRRSLLALLIFEAIIIIFASITYMSRMTDEYTEVLKDQSLEYLNVYSILVESKLETIDALSFKFLSNQDVNMNLIAYDNPQDNALLSFRATSNLYSHLFTHWYMNEFVLGMDFIFNDGMTVRSPIRHYPTYSREYMTAELFQAISEIAESRRGSSEWGVNLMGENTITLYRKIKDISSFYRFKTLGLLHITADASFLFADLIDLPTGERPEILLVAGDQVISSKPDSENQQRIKEFLINNDTARYEFPDEDIIFSTKDLNISDWYLIYIMPAEALFSRVGDISARYILSFLAIVFIITLFTYLFANSITKPIISLSKRMKAAENKDYTLALNETHNQSYFEIIEVAQLNRNFRKMIRKIDYLINEDYAKQLTILEMKYKILQQQINPHFLYNTLDTINWKAIKAGNQDIVIMVRSLSDMLRNSISKPATISLAEELKLVNDYVAIQRIRYEDKLVFSTDVVENLLSSMIPKLTLQPIVENAIVHNLEKYALTCIIKLKVYQSEGETIVISIEDNGPHADLDRVEKIIAGEQTGERTSIGLRNINERIRLTFGKQWGISIENMEQTGKKVLVRIPKTEE